MEISPFPLTDSDAVDSDSDYIVFPERRLGKGLLDTAVLSLVYFWMTHNIWNTSTSQQHQTVHT